MCGETDGEGVCVWRGDEGGGGEGGGMTGGVRDGNDCAAEQQRCFHLEQDRQADSQGAE